MSTDLDREKLEERQTVRLKVLKTMFDATIGSREDTELYRFDSGRLMPRLELSKTDIRLALKYLHGEGLLTRIKGDWSEPVYELNHRGVVEVERAIEYPNQRTQHFMQSVVQHFHAQVGSVQNGPDATANVEQRTHES